MASQPLGFFFNLPCCCVESLSCDWCQQLAANITRYLEGASVHPQPGSATTSGSLPCDANSMSQADVAFSLPRSDCSEVPTDTIPMVLVDPLSTRSATEAVDEGVHEFLSPVYPAGIGACLEAVRPVHPSPAATSEDPSDIANLNALITSWFNCSEVPVAAPPTPLTDPPPRQPTSEVIADGGSESLFHSSFINIASTVEPEGVYPSPGSLVTLQDANPISQVEGGLSMSPFGCSEAPMVILLTPSTDPLSPQPATKTITEGASDLLSHSPPAGPVPGEAIDAKPNLPPSKLSHCPRHKKRKCGYLADQMGGQAIWVYKYPCVDCRKHFSGKLEMDRHFKSAHGPRTLGCRGCGYRQSRKDVLREHCKKRHPGQSIESLIVPLVTMSISFKNWPHAQE